MLFQLVNQQYVLKIPMVANPGNISRHEGQYTIYSSLKDRASPRSVYQKSQSRKSKDLRL
jgi:hypothetical protein